jgi:hypothetical protein
MRIIWQPGSLPDRLAAMGWRDINMSRRRPPMRHAVIAVEEGQDERQAVLRKACRAALPMLAQLPSVDPGFEPFVAGYLAGFARHQALKHGCDAERDEDGPPMQELLAELAGQVPPPIRDEVASLRFSPRTGACPSPRAQLGAEQGLADAGYLVGHLESLCRTEKLLAAAHGLLPVGKVEAFLTACDVAADPMQTHQPTMSLRFDLEEREILRQALGVRPQAGSRPS